MNAREWRILLVEDNPAEQVLAQRAFLRCAPVVNLQIAGDGEIAWDLLQQSRSTSSPPHLILLDINLPKRNGLEFLQLVKGHDHWKMTPVVMLSNSTRREEVLKAYQLGCNAFLQKPPELEDFLATIKILQSFWFDFSILPSREEK